MVKKLLIITQKVNKNDPILGFFHGWIIEFANHFESIVGICLEKGEYDLPSNVRVLSLGKEGERNDQFSMTNSQFFKRLRYVVRFWLYIWRERKNYDAVFVHMNQEYVLLGGLFWLIMKKKVYMWRNHHAGSFLTDAAAFFCNKVFCTSKYSFTAKYKKTVLMPVGINTDLFERKANIERVEKSILFLGRISPVKKPGLLIDALIELRRQGIVFSASFYGDSLPTDRQYHESLKQKIKDSGLSGQVKFYPGVPNEKTVEVYNKHQIFVNLSSSGMYDKTIFEAMACECLVLASNKNLHGLIDEIFIFEEGNIEELILKLNFLLLSNIGEIRSWGEILRLTVVSNHNLRSLAIKIKEIIQG